MITIQYNLNKQLMTLHTNIKRGAIAFGTPMSYDIMNNDEVDTKLNTINIQKGSVDKYGNNGVFIEDLLLIVVDQLEHLQASEYACIENEDILRHLRDALSSIRAKEHEATKKRILIKNEKLERGNS